MDWLMERYIIERPSINRNCAASAMGACNYIKLSNIQSNELFVTGTELLRLTMQSEGVNGKNVYTMSFIIRYPTLYQLEATKYLLKNIR